MQIGDWVFVEVSAKGNACYPYAVEKLPFEMGSSTYSRADLKSQDAIRKSKTERLLHFSTWESVFDSALSRCGIVPNDHDGSRRSAPRPVSSAPEINPFTSGVADQPAWARFFLPATVRLIIESGARVDDLRPKGGSLWVYPGSASEELHLQLSAAGFKYRFGRGYHRE
jgi:hypothetical protein